jgi:hypothetical protein
MNKIFNVFPATLKEIYDAIMANRRYGTDADKALDTQFFTGGLVQVYKFLEQPDAATEAIYGAPDADGNVTFPFAISKVKPGVVEFVGKLGAQTSSYHKETVKQHTAIVVKNLVDAGVDPKMAAVLGVFHDCGKKYTTGTNAKGELCFYGHDYVSAYLAGQWLKDSFNMSGNELKLVMAVIFAHMQPKITWNQNPEKRVAFMAMLDEFFDDDDKKEEYKQYFEFLIDAIDKADVGIATEEEVAAAEGIIAEGESAICFASDTLCFPA